MENDNIWLLKNGYKFFVGGYRIDDNGYKGWDNLIQQIESPAKLFSGYEWRRILLI